jgi:Fe-S oxidoreductase
VTLAGHLLELEDAERRALRYCTYCPKMCRFACPVAHGEARETVTPWGLMRLLNLVDQGVVASDGAVLEALEHCVSCGRCTTFCVHENPVAEVLAKGRSQLVASGLAVPEAWAVPPGGCGVAAQPWRAMEVDRPAFLPSCAHFQTPEATRALVRGLDALESHALGVSVPVGPEPYGCGFHEWEVGATQAASASWERFTQAGRGRPACITDCAPSLWALGADGPGKGGAPAVRHLADWLAEHLERLPAGSIEGRVVLHDACFPTRRLGLGTAIRALVAHLAGGPAVELHEAGAEARCCGASGHWAEVRPDAQARAAATVVADLADARPDLVVTSSAACRLALERAVAKAGLVGSAGEPVVVVDLLGLLARSVRDA